MSDPQVPIRLTIGIGAIVLVAVAVVSVFSVREYSAVSSPSLIAAPDRDAESQAVKHCRTISPEQYASEDACRRVWAEQRRRFFGLDRQGSKASITKVPTSPSPSWEPSTEATNKQHARHPTPAAPED